MRPVAPNYARRRPRMRGSVALVLTTIILGVAAWKFAGPLTTLRAEQSELSQVRVERAALIAERDRWRQYKHRLATEAGQETVARRHGYVKPGERRLLFVSEDEGGRADDGAHGEDRK